MTILDITRPIEHGMEVYPGDPEVHIEVVADPTWGDPALVSRLSMGTHAGTHVDAPRHARPGAMPVDALPLAAMLGPAWVADGTWAPGDLGADDLDRLAMPPGTRRLLMRFGVRTGGPGLRPDAAARLRDGGIVLVGTDGDSIASAHDPMPTHHVLLDAGVVVLEGLDLTAADTGEWDLLCLPLRLAGGEAAPARVVIRR